MISSRKHLIADLKSYVCIFDDCSADLQHFDLETEWFEHARWSHNLHWSCYGFEHPLESFYDAASLMNYMATVHPTAVRKKSLDKLAKLCVRPSATAFEQSPFCSYHGTD